MHVTGYLGSFFENDYPFRTFCSSADKNAKIPKRSTPDRPNRPVNDERPRRNKNKYLRVSISGNLSFVRHRQIEAPKR